MESTGKYLISIFNDLEEAVKVQLNMLKQSKEKLAHYEIARYRYKIVDTRTSGYNCYQNCMTVSNIGIAFFTVWKSLLKLL